MYLNELPLYRDTYELNSAIVDIVETFPKKYKFTLGDRMVIVGMDLFTYLTKAHANRKNKDAHDQYMEEYINAYFMFRTIVRICIEKKIINIKQASRLALIFEPIEVALKLNCE